MRISSLDTETPESNIALLCTPSESYDISTWNEFIEKFMIRKNLKTIYFCWNLRFDSQAILKLLPYDKLIELWKSKEHRIEYEGFRITYIPKKLLRIAEIKNKRGAIHLYDASQYYENKSLDSQAKEYLNEGKLDAVSAKQIGKSYSYYKKNYKEIVKYCKRDAELTLKLALFAMDNVKDLGFNPSNPISPATISRKYQKDVKGWGKRLDKMELKERQANNIAMYAYKGGIFSTLKKGYFKDKLYDYDVNSCYPAIMINLPDWRNGEFEFMEETGKPENYEYGWVAVELDSEYVPYRCKENYEVKEIYEGIGEWNMKYTARKVVFPVGIRIEIITTEEYRWLFKHKENVKWLKQGIGWVKKTDKYPRPFGWMKEMFKKRAALKKKGNKALAQTLKLLMNSLYGSTVMRKNGIGDLTNFCYGSYITARARLQMFDVVIDNYDFIVNIATDGILTTKKLGERENEREKSSRKVEKRDAHTSLHPKSRGERRSYRNGIESAQSDTRANQSNDRRNEYKERDNIRTIEEDTTKGFRVGSELGEWEYTEYSKGLVIGNGIRQLWTEDGLFETHARGITSDRKFDLMKEISAKPLNNSIQVGRTRVIQLGTMVNAHIKWRHNDLNSFVKQSRVMNIDTDKKRRWMRDYENFRDLVESEPVESEPIRMSDINEKG
jgi:hypothetical protein